jgi:hypothetical protein
MPTRNSRPAKRRASRTKTREAPSQPSAPPLPSYARGNPLTHSVAFTDAGGTCWLVYVEPAPTGPGLWPGSAVLPGRRLRFDSLAQSLSATPVPPGSPFLSDARLQECFERSQPIEEMVTPPSPVNPRVNLSLESVPPVPDVQLFRTRDQRSWTHRVAGLAQSAVVLLAIARDAILHRARN